MVFIFGVVWLFICLIKTATFLIYPCAVEKLGNVGCQGGPVMAASDRFELDVYGKGGHGAAPHGNKICSVCAIMA